MALIPHMTRVITQVARNCTNMVPISAMGAHRLFATRSDCAPPPWPRCSPENLAKKPCDPKKSPTLSTWFNPECCNDPCYDMLPRFDDLYYKPSDKLTRCYKRTWVECPEIKIIPKKVCCYEMAELPPIERRTPAKVPKTACCPVEEAVCKFNAIVKCRKIQLPCCADVRDPPRCSSKRAPSDCKKVCCPYPSFSECRRCPVKPLRPTECGCLKVAPWCIPY